MIPFGPQLIGQTEKALNALLVALLTETGLSEPQWVALRLAAQFDGDGRLADVIRDRAFFADPETLLNELRARGLVEGEKLTDAGATLLHRTGDRIAGVTAPIWEGLDTDDTAAAARVLHTVLERTRAVVGDLEAAAVPAQDRRH